MTISKIDQLRLGLMGLSKLTSERSDRQQRLRTIIMCRPVLRKFKAEQYHLWDRQARYFLKRTYFLTSRSYSEIIELASELVDLDAELSAGQDTDYLEKLDP